MQVGNFPSRVEKCISLEDLQHMSDRVKGTDLKRFNVEV
jgi:hypothetical protein